MRIARALKVWAGQIRAPFLVLSVLLVLIGGAVALKDGVFDGLRFALAMIGVTLAHVAVNLFNELSDHLTGIDMHTRRTPFSGGSGTLQQGHTTPRAVRIAAFAALGVAFAIGLYLAWVSGWALMALIAAGGLAAVFYTTHLARWVLGELAAGVCLGTFVVLGSYYAQAGTLTPAVIWLSVPPGILTALLLLLNEFPDVEADREGGRRHLVITLGWRRAAVVYTASLAASYLILVAGVLLDAFPATVLLALLTLPLACKAAYTALRHGDRFEKLVPALGANVGMILGTDLLIAVAYFI
ncbi:MAG: prenyltransferase [Deltaproteobacteria bacterium]|nr:prenyltransferase [Deltaproteobacteria bacterium]